MPSPVVLLSLGAALLLVGCRSTDEMSYYLVGSEQARAENSELLSKLSNSNGADRPILLRTLVSNLREADEPLRAVHLLTDEVGRNPDDPYNAYYLLLAGRIYERTGSPDFALRYYRAAVDNHPDVSMNGASVHQTVLRSLVELLEAPKERIRYFERLVSTFPDAANNGITHYAMARTYEQLGEWEPAARSYRAFLSFPDTEVPNRPRAQREVEHKLAFSRSNRSWTRESLESLVEEIRVALSRQNLRALYNLQSDVNFFAASRNQDTLDANSTYGFDIQVFLSQSNVRVANEFEVNSNNREAFLRTDGWYDRVSTWYLYFRRIDFPADPSVHGNWEWAGIRFGEVL